MNFSEEAIQSAKDRVHWLIDNQSRIPVRSTTPISFYYKTSNNLIDEAEFYYQKNQFEQSFILYSRYITLFIEDLKKYHRDYPNVSINERERVKEIMRKQALPRAEELKLKLLDKYTREYDERQKSIQQLTTTDLDKQSTTIHYENELALQQTYSKPTYDRSQKPTDSIKNGMGTFRRINIPNDITSKFLQTAQRNTAQSIETCGILAGYRKDNNQYAITHIIVPKQNGGPDSCDTEKEEEVVEYISNHNLITLGWIHTHPSQTAFLSSVDLHTHLPYQMLMQEAIAIVISPKFNETAIFSLTPDTGIPVISTCRKTGFHEHVNNPPLYLISSHTSYDPGLQCQIVDLRI